MSLVLMLNASWALAHSLLYGFHVAALNGVQASVVCDGGARSAKMGIHSCVPLTDAQFGIVVTIFTIGGLVGSLSSDMVTRRYGRVGTLRIAELCFIAGSAMVGLANTMWIMVIGRILIGYAAGLSMVTVPNYLSTISPQRFKKAFGAAHQMTIGLGMIIAQSLSFAFDAPFKWRYSLLVAVGLSVLVFVVALGKSDSVPADHGQAEEGTALLPRDKDSDLSVVELLTTKDAVLFRGLIIIVVAQFAQQVSGISPIMYFSTKTLAPVFQTGSKAIALFVMAIGIPFNFAPALLPNKVTSKHLLMLSALGTAASSLTLALALNHHQAVLSAASMIAFVIFFSIGLAPVAWVVLGEVLPQEARTAAGSIGVSVNWLTNFAAGSAFLPISNALAGQGSVFFLFAGTSILALVLVYLSYHLYDNAIAEKEERD